ncbi:uncharacterized protein ColSpa_05955 [Colletotrichum spaethianum]|uniref:Uncharacterized protein n=1 Tax=Colletotrichum spaethianum TaxID=700344 RepID=A0AA37LE77_9PEZI|nr:uncharacterized protein ColSpa_05955 [Colletotrichum spaethianum]GKT45774.1 hypothetical protein ColSpa_05955 [Colletotrichum spaethianum]
MAPRRRGTDMQVNVGHNAANDLLLALQLLLDMTASNHGEARHAHGIALIRDGGAAADHTGHPSVSTRFGLGTRQSVMLHLYDRENASLDRPHRTAIVTIRQASSTRTSLRHAVKVEDFTGPTSFTSSQLTLSRPPCLPPPGRAAQSPRNSSHPLTQAAPYFPSLMVRDIGPSGAKVWRFSTISPTVNLLVAYT